MEQEVLQSENGGQSINFGDNESSYLLMANFMCQPDWAMSAQIFGLKLLCLYLCRRFWMRLTFAFADRAKQMTLPSEGGLLPMG